MWLLSAWEWALKQCWTKEASKNDVWSWEPPLGEICRCWWVSLSKMCVFPLRNRHTQHGKYQHDAPNHICWPGLMSGQTLDPGQNTGNTRNNFLKVYQLKMFDIVRVFTFKETKTRPTPGRGAQLHLNRTQARVALHVLSSYPAKGNVMTTRR